MRITLLSPRCYEYSRHEVITSLSVVKHTSPTRHKHFCTFLCPSGRQHPDRHHAGLHAGDHPTLLHSGEPAPWRPTGAHAEQLLRPDGPHGAQGDEHGQPEQPLHPAAARHLAVLRCHAGHAHSAAGYAHVVSWWSTTHGTLLSGLKIAWGHCVGLWLRSGCYTEQWFRPFKWQYFRKPHAECD